MTRPIVRHCTHGHTKEKNRIARVRQMEHGRAMQNRPDDGIQCFLQTGCRHRIATTHTHRNRVKSVASRFGEERRWCAVVVHPPDLRHERTVRNGTIKDLVEIAVLLVMIAN